MRFKRLLLLSILLITPGSWACGAPGESELAETDSGCASTLESCRALREALEREVARCGTAFQLDDPTVEPFRITGQPTVEAMPDIPSWVPRIQNLMSKSNLADRVESDLGGRQRSWGERGAGGELAALLWFNEVVVHTDYIDAFDAAGYLVSDWTSQPSRSAHALSVGRGPHLHYIVASDPATCRSVHVALTGYPDSAAAPFPAKFDGPVTEIQVAFREPAGR